MLRERATLGALRDGTGSVIEVLQEKEDEADVEHEDGSAADESDGLEW